ncbi:MAG: hypothetical protein CFE28_13735 [Alphaproteobacteria bacterium PA2]|nr:MAG: hypothetical protein CFE28_13735 [Alphaproteobacteria bacterium PA2]
MKISSGFLMSLAVVLASASTASAQLGPPNPDVNRDGKVTLPEFRSVSSSQLLQRLDTNKDGILARAEYQSAVDMISRFAGAEVGRRAARRFSEDDGNQDGQLSRAEMDLGAQKRFAKADANGDGWLDKAELKASRQPARDDARD